MSILSLRRFDIQAKWSVGVAILAVVPLGAALLGLMQRYDSDLGAIQYGRDSLFVPIFLACIATACVLALTGVILGFNSAGQRRNNEQKKSWMGFFIGTGALSLALILFVAFRMLKLQIALGGS